MHTFSLTLSSLIVLLGSAYADSSDDKSVTQKAKEKIPAVSLKSAKAIAAAAAETQKNMAKKKVDPRFLRVQQLHQRRKAYIADYANGAVRPFPEIVKNWPTYQSKLANLKALHETWRSTSDASEKAKLQARLLTDLQPLGSFLRSASHKGSIAKKLSAAEQDEVKSLAKQYNSVAEYEGEEDVVTLTSLPSPYTLKFLPTPITFSAPAGTEILLSSETAGRFSNDLSRIKIKANKQGVASTWWISYGGAVSTSTVTYRSASTVGVQTIYPVVQRLEMLDLETLSPVLKKQTSILSQ